LGIGIGLLAAAVTVFMVRPPGEVPPFPTSVGISNIADARAGATVPGSRGAADDNRALQSVIIGARLTDYQVLGLDTARETAAAEIAHALRSIPGGGVAAANFEPAGGLTTDIVSAVESVVDVRIFRSAQWLELTRLAAAAGDWRTLERPDLNGSLAKVGKPHADRIIEQIAARGDTKGIADLATEALSELSRR
jgi:hypothetical protein